MALHLKPGVVMAGLSPVMRTALLVSARIMKAQGVNLSVLSALDGEHSPGSLHFYGFAIDIRSTFLSAEQRQLVLTQLTDELPDYQVRLASKGTPNEHYHIESEKGFYRHLSLLNSLQYGG